MIREIFILKIMFSLKNYCTPSVLSILSATYDV